MNRLTSRRSLFSHRPLLALAIAGVAVFSVSACAHPGGIAADGCHKHTAADERHWHFEGTAERAGACVERDGRTVKLAPPKVRIAELEAALESARTEMQAAERRIAELSGAVRDGQSRIAAVTAQAERDVVQARATAEKARQDADTAQGEAEQARAAARDAQARAAGHGPRVDQRCGNAVRGVVHARPDWTGDVELDEEDRAALARACLES